MQLKVIQNLTRSVGPLEDALVALPVRRQAKSDPRESHLTISPKLASLPHTNLTGAHRRCHRESAKQLELKTLTNLNA